MILPLLLALAVTITPTPTSTPTPSSTSEIQKVRELVQQKLKKIQQQITDPISTKKAIVGKVIQISATEITIDHQNTTRNLTIDTDTVYIDAKRNKSNLDKIKIGQDILAMGINNTDNNVFNAKRIVFINISSLQPKQTVVIGKIVDISRSSPIFTLIPSKNKNALFQIKTDAATAVFDKDQKEIFIPNLKSGHKIITILTPDTKATKTYYSQKIFDLDYAPSPTPTKKP